MQDNGGRAVGGSVEQLNIYWSPGASDVNLIHHRAVHALPQRQTTTVEVM